jgi:glutamine synthetase adenylyltransferase
MNSWDDIAAARLPVLRERTDEPDRLDGLIERLRACVEEGGLSAALAEAALDRLSSGPEPVELLLRLVTLCESSEGRAVLEEPEALATFLTLAAQGEHPARSMQRRPEDLSYLAGASATNLIRGLESLKGELHGRIEAAVASGESREHAVFTELRRLKRRESLRIYLREVENTTSVRQTTAEIAELAEACIDVACSQGSQVMGGGLYEHFCVLGMGKLGGRELNFSSDVDLIYVSSDQAAEDAELKTRIDQLARWVTRAMESVSGEGYVFRVDLRLRPEGSKGLLVNTAGAMVDYYLNWGRTWERSAMVKARPVGGNLALGNTLIEALEPFIYRRYLDFDVLDELRSMKEQIDRNAHVSAVLGIDESEVEEEPAKPSDQTDKPSSSLQERLRRKMRRSGAPARGRLGRSSQVSISSGGDEEPSAQAVLADEPEKSSGSKHSDSKRSDSEGSDSEPSPRGSRSSHAGSPYGWDVKIGVGGIREIEFFVQALQLIHCGSRPALRVRTTLEALDRLLYAGLISHEDHAVLADAYDLFRRVEHRVQMEKDRQSHRLPADPEGFEKLAARMFTDPARLRERLTFFRRKVAGMFERLFTESAQTSKEPTVRESRPSELAMVLGVSPERLFDKAVLDALEKLGYRRPRQVAGQLQVLREKSYGPYGRRSGTEQSQLSRYILQACATAPNPDQAFSYWSRLSTVVGDRPGFYDMLFENPHATRLLLHVFGSSDFLASIVMREPNVIDYLLGAGTVAIVRERDEMKRELDRRQTNIHDPSHRLGRLRRFHQEEILRIALHEVAGACDIGETVRQLSMLAEVTVEGVLAEVYGNMAQRLASQKGLARDALPALGALPFVVLGVGKLGGRELAFGSDLDVIFVYEPDEAIGLDHPFFAKLAQRLVRNLTSVSAHGKLYDVDTRLRPSGRQGTLVVSLDALRDYHQTRADLWERQAMIRARPLTGAIELRAKLIHFRDEIAFEKSTVETRRMSGVKAQFHDMRDKMVEHLGGEADDVDIKTQPGGMIDVEFLAQYLQFVHGAQLGSSEMSGEEIRGDTVIEGVKSQNTMHALAGLAGAFELPELEPDLDCVQLLEDYRTLRRIEARLRMSDQRASNRLPTDDEELHILARRLGYQGSGARAQFEADLEALSRRVAGQFEAVLGGG